MILISHHNTNVHETDHSMSTGDLSPIYDVIVGGHSQLEPGVPNLLSGPTSAGHDEFCARLPTILSLRQQDFQLLCSLWMEWVTAGNTKGGSITVPLTSCWTGLELAV
jgi:hypothetical protein